VGRVWPRHGRCGRPLNSVVSPQMKQVLVVLALMIAPISNALAVDGWEVTRPELASRRVVATLYSGKVVVDRWMWPVGKDVEVVDREQIRTVTFPKQPKNFPKRMFAITWIAGTNSEDTVLRFAWYRGESLDSPRILNNYLIVPFSTKETFDLGNGVRMEAVYESAG
jgi:hypothetical protein